MGKSTYWDTVADYARTVVDRGRASDADPLRLSAFELVASAPSAILAQATMAGKPAAARENPHLVARSSEYNGLIRRFCRCRERVIWLGFPA